MKESFICVIDSGIGGLSVLSELVKLMPNENYLYFGDNDNAPYGNLSKRKLWNITMENLVYLSAFSIKTLVVGCNTLSVSFLKDIEKFSGKETFGVFPPIEKALTEDGEATLFATETTSKKYGGIKGLKTFGLKSLASEIEKNCLNLSSFVPDFESANSVIGGCLVLGCTHYSLIKKQIIDHFFPRKIFCGEKLTAKIIYEKHKKNLIVKNDSKTQVKFVGKNANKNELVWENVVNI